jgi:hypothetical protein
MIFLQVLIENGILDCLAHLIARRYPKNIKKQACLIVSNIATGSKDQIQVLSSEPFCISYTNALLAIKGGVFPM